ncbi:MAG: 50S ribosomal protein L18 [Candidatus Thorarchaeota archaeon]
MAKGPRYRRPLRRREEGKTNYSKRLKLLKSKKIRAVIRASNNHISIQFIESKLGGDRILCSAHSKELVTQFGWKANTKNVPASYLTGYLAGLKAKKNKVEGAILDLGIFYHRNRILAAVQGLLKAEIDIPYRDEFFPESLNKRISGSHIEEYATLLKNEDTEKYNQIFSGYIKKNKINPVKISQIFNDTFKTITNKM